MAKLITKADEKKFERFPMKSQDGKGGDAEVLVKFFYPYGSGTWLVTEAEKQEDGTWLFFGAAHIHEWEWGYFSEAELRSVIKFGRPAIERERYAPPATIRDEWKEVA